MSANGPDPQERHGSKRLCLSAARGAAFTPGYLEARRSLRPQGFFWHEISPPEASDASAGGGTPGRPGGSPPRVYPPCVFVD